MDIHFKPVGLQLEKTYTLKSLKSAIALSSDNLATVVAEMRENHELERVITLFDLDNFETDYRHPLITLIRKVGDSYWEGIMTVSTFGNTQPVSITRKFLKIKLDPCTENLSLVEIKQEIA